MGVLHPLRVVISGLPADDARTFVVPDYPFDASKGVHSITIEESVFIDKSDFRMTDSPVSVRN